MTKSSQQPIASLAGKGRAISALLLLYAFGVLVLTTYLSNYHLEIAPPPAVEVVIEKPDFETHTNVQEKKQAFFDYLRPFIKQTNDRIEEERQKLLAIKSSWENKNKLSKQQLKYIQQLLESYKVEDSFNTVDKQLKELTYRVDILPESMVLAQAAIESGWGTSRFATEGNNFFGHWCYEEGCGLVPLQRHEDAGHEVAAFSSPAESVSSYFTNINTYTPYKELRSLRAILRMADKPITGTKLASGLTQYSERRDEYVEDVRAVIRINDLEESTTELTEEEQAEPNS